VASSGPRTTSSSPLGAMTTRYGLALLWAVSLSTAVVAVGHSAAGQAGSASRGHLALAPLLRQSHSVKQNVKGVT
jgi:hypothetical protein